MDSEVKKNTKGDSKNHGEVDNRHKRQKKNNYPFNTVIKRRLMLEFKRQINTPGFSPGQFPPAWILELRFKYKNISQVHPGEGAKWAKEVGYRDASYLTSEQEILISSCNFIIRMDKVICSGRSTSKYQLIHPYAYSGIKPRGGKVLINMTFLRAQRARGARDSPPRIF